MQSSLDELDCFCHCALGRALCLTHQNDEALAALDVSLELNPSFAQAYFAQGFNLLWYGREIEAETLLDRATMLSPRDSHISSFHHVRSWAHFSLGEYDIAVRVRPTGRPGSPMSPIRLLRRLRLHWAILATGRRRKRRPIELLQRKPNYSTGRRGRSSSSATMRALSTDLSKACASPASPTRDRTSKPGLPPDRSFALTYRGVHEAARQEIKSIWRFSEYGLQAGKAGLSHIAPYEPARFHYIYGRCDGLSGRRFRAGCGAGLPHLLALDPGPARPFLEGFREGLRARGYVEGKNVVLELHYAIGNPQALREVATELRRGKVDLAVSSGPATRAMTAVAEVPVLFALSGDPVELGLVKSLGQPGGNFTGSTFLSLELAGKRVELLKEAFPNLRKLAVLSNANHPGEQSEWRATKEAAEKLGIAPLYVPFAGGNELDGALSLVGDAHADALLVFPDVLTMVHRKKITDFAIAHRLPSMFGWSEYCDAGGLLSYGANQRATYFWLATYADRILRGEKPAGLPVFQPTKFELIVNLRTAEQLGLDLDKSSILFRANRVIE